MSSDNNKITTPSNIDDYLNTKDVYTWSIDDVVKWYELVYKTTTSNIHTNIYPESVIVNLRENKIDGPVLVKLSLDDCKELTNNDLKDAVQMKLQINRAIQGIISRDKQNKKLATENSTIYNEEDLMLVNLQAVYRVLSDKLQDFQSQYNKLRVDVLELIKSSSSNNEQSINDTANNPNTNNNSSPTGIQHQESFTAKNNTNIIMAKPPQLIRGSTGNSDVKITPINPVITKTSAGDNKHNNSIEPLKQLRASKEDSCEKVLRHAMKKHNLDDQDWRDYVLIICYGDKERILHADEKPVTIFKSLKQQGLHPAIMLRQKDDEYFVTSNGGTTGISGSNPDITPGGRL
ncbi:related to Protein STE50 [Saccharomycodes ludwigii]|uniref:Related to Protein STE50 n=1 Tax=Saccharomycodes ludwigii TaxID=36035 RepID=A0A376B6K6_9ASCO|nr:hypothetical protein SCDLUD_003850 [Saccharomycodes ludwigii]KAH3899570.1 hypothetical protein SCDLUD_003850 [Saccharomycodes ludwigii]SSD60326.1 related to Protein STE50 [Saccharomycodes ludwigii]